MAVAASGLEVLAGLQAGNPVDALPVVHKLVLEIARETLSEAGEVPGTTGVKVGDLRRTAAAKLASWGVSALTDDALLLVSELVTNGLRYGAGQHIEFRLALAEDVLVVEVEDRSPSRPVLRDAGLDATSGRGLVLVDALATAWGVSEDGTRTWCALKVPSAEGARS
ncbi:ATP-binding protein [Streptomyces sp. NPDC021020]|uniref:ATP-binding protein n=1 Tax=Streptomyces sp. NPDC021020 TaxID=3365109 RepID=UPI00379C8A34